MLVKGGVLRSRRESLDGASVGDDDLGLGGTRRRAEGLDLLHEVEAFDDLTEDDVGTIEPRGDDGGDEELGSVGVLSSVGHGKETGLGVLKVEVFISELLSVNGLSTGAVALGEVTSLQHEVGDDTVEARALVSESVLASAELTEVLSGLGDNLVVELEDDLSGVLAVDGDCEENVGHGDDGFGPLSS